MRTETTNNPKSAMASLRAHLRSRPAAVLSSPRADVDPKALLVELKAGFEKFKADHKAQLNTIQTSVDEMQVQSALRSTGGIGIGNDPAPDPEYTEQMLAYARGGQNFQSLVAANRDGARGALNASMSTGVGEAGGVLVPTEWDRNVQKRLRDRSPFRQIADVQTTGVNAYTTVWNMGSFGSGWAGETASRPATSTPDLRSLAFVGGELYAFPFVTQKILDDADFKLEDWLSNELSDEFDKQEGIAFVSGDGVNKPYGFLTYVAGGASDNRHPGGNLSITATGVADKLGAPDTLVDFVYALAASYRQGARWLMNSATAATIAKMKDGQGNYLWRETYVAGQPATLLGYPVSIDENMPNVGAGAIPIAFGDFKRGYVINDRFGIRLLRDPYTNKPYVGFYATKRVGGGVLDPNAIRLMKVAVS